MLKYSKLQYQYHKFHFDKAYKPKTITEQYHITYIKYSQQELPSQKNTHKVTLQQFITQTGRVINNSLPVHSSAQNTDAKGPIHRRGEPC